MPKIINPDSIAIESLTLKLNTLESQFTALEKKHTVIQDSLFTLNKTLEKTDLATSFYTTHLATYTAIIVGLFVTIIAIGTAINYFKLYNPFFKAIEKLEQITIPKVIADLKKEHEKEISEIKVEVGTALTNTHRGMIMFYKEKKDFDNAFLYISRALRTSVKYSLHERALTKKLFIALEKLSKDQIFTKGFLNHDYADEIINNLQYISKINDGKYSELIFNVRMNLEKTNMNHTKSEEDQASL